MKDRLLITGGAGSLGRAFVELLNHTYDITVVDNSEWACAELGALYPNVAIKLGDFTEIGGDWDYVIHCAAYKHVNLGESNVFSFVENNLTKTMKFYDSLTNPLTKLLYISTDKAVEPISSYGATKMLAENLTWAKGGQVARCGNFLGSSGSVIPVWESQIADQKPITITDDRMKRYVIELENAANQLWIGFIDGQKLIIPEMEEISLLDLLTKVLNKHGYATPEDYAPGYVAIGLRPGEKLAEKLRWDHECQE